MTISMGETPEDRVRTPGQKPQDRQNRVKQIHLKCLLNQRFATMLRITDSLSFKSALLLIDVRVLDHLVVGYNEEVSFAERGLL